MITKDREYRAFKFSTRQSDEGEMVVEGYAAVFEKETVIYESENSVWAEKIDKNAFDDADLKDVVMNFNHQGKPVARTKNQTLKLTVDDVGLKVAATLSGTEEARKLFEEIKGGYIDKMSFAFSVTGEETQSKYEEGEKDSYLRTITSFGKIYDVAAVDLPAYEDTSINARNKFKAEAEKFEAEARMEILGREKIKNKIRIIAES